MSAEFISALDALTKERNIDKDVLLSAIELALVSAYKLSLIHISEPTRH